jgi:hypothetical protein
MSGQPTPPHTSKHLRFKQNRHQFNTWFDAAAGQIAYALAPLIASGQMLGSDTPVLLQLYDVPAAQGLLQVRICRCLVS